MGYSAGILIWLKKRARDVYAKYMSKQLTHNKIIKPQLYKIAALIPTYNHYLALETVVNNIKKNGLDILIVDDGSNNQTKNVIKKILDENPSIMHLSLSQNSGKGVAVCKGFHFLNDKGYTHAFQIDADGQHDLSVINQFIQVSSLNPSALISGKPEYDDSMPTSRRIGRWFTHVWVFIETLSFRITDSMCGFRIYPLQETTALLAKKSVGKRMDFDTEIMVRLFWNGVPTLMLPVDVIYPKNNTSNFDVLADNWRITKMHTNLVFYMIAHLFSILKNRPDYKKLNRCVDGISWASLEERGSLLGMYVLSLIYSVLGKTLCKIVGAEIILYYYLTATEQKKASKQFLTKVLGRPAGFMDTFRHFMNFFDMALDKFSAWTGYSTSADIALDGLDNLKNVMSQRGGVLLVSHIGNMEFCRAVATHNHQQRLHVLLHTKNSKRFHQMLRFFNPKSNINLIEVTDVGPDTIIYLKDKINQGDFVVIAADRFPVNGDKRVCYVPFLGKEAPFSQGPYILSSLLECPVYTSTAVKVGKQYNVMIDLFADKIILDRQDKDASLKKYCTQYALYLEKIATQYPYQWYNFFDFWQKL